MMTIQTHAKELCEWADDYNSSNMSPLYEEIMISCIVEAKNGKYRYIHYLEDEYSTEELCTLRDNLKSHGFDVNLQTLEKVKFQPKWYQFNKCAEYDVSIMVIIDWDKK